MARERAPDGGDDRAKKLRFHMDIDIGTVIQIVAVLGGGMIFAASLSAKVDQGNAEIAGVKTEIGDLRKTIDNTVSRLDRRIDNIASTR